MEFLYHRVVEDMRGTVLYPLNQLKELYPDVYAAHVKKYVGREEVLESRIPPPLDCLWNDVLHFTAVPPTVLFENLQNAGFDAKELVWKKWYKIPTTLLDPQNTIVCLYRRDISLVPQARDFHPFDLNKMEEYRAVPPEILEYYKEKQTAGERPLFFHRVPHILFKGTVDISNCEIVEV